MNKLEAWRKGTTDHRINFVGITNWRAHKKMERKLCGGVYEAYCIGSMDGNYGPYNNPYRPGLRHDEYDRGYQLGIKGETF